MKGKGGQIDPPPEKTTLKKPSLIRVKYWLNFTKIENEIDQYLTDT